MGKVSKEYLGLAGEYAVASELARRDIYAQLTMGTHKRTDLLIDMGDRMNRVQVKAKQSTQWPGVSGVPSVNDYLVLVDYQGKGLEDPPDFYVLNMDDWISLVNKIKDEHPDAVINERYEIKFRDGWKGLNLRSEQVEAFKSDWLKISRPSN